MHGGILPWKGLYCWIFDGITAERKAASAATGKICTKWNRSKNSSPLGEFCISAKAGIVVPVQFIWANQPAVTGLMQSNAYLNVP